MKNIFGILVLICLLLILASLGISQPNAGMLIAKGYKINNSVVNVTSATAVALLSAESKRADAIIYNTSTTNSLYISSYTAMTGNATVGTGGFEIPKQTWFSFDGKFVGIVYGIGPAGASGTTNVVTILEGIWW